MEDATIRSKIAGLLRKSTQAVRLYSSVRGSSADVNSIPYFDGRRIEDLAQLQSYEWRQANESLCSSLGTALKLSNIAEISAELLRVREFFRGEWRGMEREVHRAHRALERAAVQAEYMDAAIVSVDLIRWKARCDAHAAVYEEVVALAKTCRLASSEGSTRVSRNVRSTSQSTEEIQHENCDEPSLAIGQIRERLSETRSTGGQLLSFKR